VATVIRPGETAPDAFVVVVNGQDQRALWQAGLDLPAGWRRASAVMSGSECLAAIDASWPDVTPASVRAGAAADGGGDRFVHEVFAEQAARRPDAPAVLAGRTRLSYRELDASANRLAHYLGDIGAGPESVIGVYLERGVDVISAILAIMKAGACYLPLDPSLPPERLSRICSQVRPAAVIAASRDAFPCTGTRLLPLGELAAELAGRPATAPAVRLHPDNLCYAIYTSGSTGDPKPVAVSHGNLACVIGELTREYEVADDDRIGQMASMAFDTSIEQVLVALTGGATLLLPPPGTMAPSELLRRVERRHVTVLDLTPAYWHQLLALTGPADERLRSVRLMITGGEPADPEVCRSALRAAPCASRWWTGSWNRCRPGPQERSASAGRRWPGATSAAPG
jgi:non-ribosomal peptide synthetase component F